MNKVTYARNPLMSDFTESYFETTDRVKLRYLHKGEGMPLILLHGYCDDADCWLLNASTLAEHYAVYCLEQRGHGMSKANYGGRISRLAADLHEFIESLGVPKVNVLGWSMGCSVLWSYIDLFGQERLNKVVFNDEPVMLTSNPQFSGEEVMRTGSNPMDVWYLVNTVENYGTDWTDPDAPFNKAFPACFRRGVLYIPEEDIAKVPDCYSELYAQRPPVEEVSSYAFMAALLKDHLMLDWRDVMPRIKVPVQFLSGDISHAVTLEMCQWLQGVIPNFEWVRFSEEEFGTHDLQQLAYKKFNRVVLEFLRK